MKPSLGMNASGMHQKPRFQLANRVARRHQFVLLVGLAKQPGGILGEPARLPRLARLGNGVNGHPQRFVNECDFSGDQFDRQDIGMLAKL
jgi:hypothetical protein